MSREEADAFLRETRVASLSSLGPRGQPVTIPVWFEWDGEVARAFSSKGAAKVRRIKADPRVNLTAYEGAGLPEAWVSIEGIARLQDEGTGELVKRLADRYYEAEHAARVKEEWLRGEANLVTIVITPERVRSYRAEW
jgi:PPOX class probable F420-dependent enzyme